MAVSNQQKHIIGFQREYSLGHRDSIYERKRYYRNFHCFVTIKFNYGSIQILAEIQQRDSQFF